MLYEVLRKLENVGAVFGEVGGTPAVKVSKPVEGLEEELRKHQQDLLTLVERWGGGPAKRLLNLYLSGYVPVNTAWELHNVAKNLAAAPAIAIDLETTGLDPRNDSVRLISIADEVDTYVVDAWKIDKEDIRAALQPLFEGRQTVVFHNAVFDLAFLMRMGIEPARKAVFDTGLAEQVLSAAERLPKLKVLAAVYLRLLVDKTLQRSDWSGELSEEQLRYAAADARVTYLIYKLQEKRLIEEGLYKAAQVDFEAVPAVVWMSNAGVGVDLECWFKQMEHSAVNFEAAKEEVAKVAPNINPNSPPKLKEFLNANGVPVKNVREPTLKQYADHPLVAPILKYKKWQKRVSTYGQKWLSFIDKNTGRIYPKWKVTGAATGRMSCSDPNIMQAPRDADFRKCFRAPKGRALVKGDFSQIELRLAAFIVGDVVMLSALERGEDLHIKTAAAITGKDPGDITKEERQLAKTVNFGILYGMTEKGLKAQIFSEYGIRITLEEAAEALNRFFDTYPEIAEWHANAPDGPTVVQTLSGRRRRVNSKQEYLNTPVQGSGADLIKMALARLYERRKEVPGMVPVIVVHDEIVLEVPEEHAEAALKLLKETMLEAAQELTGGGVKIEVEGGIYKDWGVTKVEAHN